MGPFLILLRGRDLHPRPPGYEPGELLLLHPAINTLYPEVALITRRI